jgi:hypothetical protein
MTDEVLWFLNITVKSQSPGVKTFFDKARSIKYNLKDFRKLLWKLDTLMNAISFNDVFKVLN